MHSNESKRPAIQKKKKKKHSVPETHTLSISFVPSSVSFAHQHNWSTVTFMHSKHTNRRCQDSKLYIQIRCGSQFSAPFRNKKEIIKNTGANTCTVHCTKAGGPLVGAAATVAAVAG